jgi:hypothetical protein
MRNVGKRELVNAADPFLDDRRNLPLQARIIAQQVARRTTQNGQQIGWPIMFARFLMICFIRSSSMIISSGDPLDPVVSDGTVASHGSEQ